MTVKTAVVGLGWWGREHVRSVAGSTKMEIVHLVDPDLATAKPYAEDLGLPLSAEYEDVLSDGRIDAVILATPHDLHTKQVVAAAKAGKHVFTEKPFAMSKADAKKQVAACKEAGVQLGIGLIQRFLQPHHRIKQLLEDGQLGTALHGDACVSHDVLLNIDTWRKDPLQAPAGGIHHTGTHLIDLFIWMLGPVKKVYGQISGHIFENDTAVAILTFASGQTATITNVMATAELRYFHLYASEGWARRINDTTLVVRTRGGEEEEITFPPSLEVRANNEAFADAVAGHAAYPISTDDMIHNVAVLDAIAESMRLGKPVDVEGAGN